MVLRTRNRSGPAMAQTAERLAGAGLCPDLRSSPPTMAMAHGDQQWWRETVVYQVYPRSFYDSDGDGIGDLPGITANLDYFRELGVETIWLSPFYRSPQRDFGYDISDFRDVAPEYGTLADADTLIAEAHRRGLRVVLDMVLNHTSDQHPWFIESRSRRDHPRRDWYVWRDGRRPGGKAPPNNWYNMIGSRGWHYDSATDQWYWAQFLPFQPDLNYRNPAVRREMFDVLRFWLERGADGFRLDIINALFEDAEFRDNPFCWRLFPAPDDPSVLFRRPERTLNHPDTLAFVRELRRFVDGADQGSPFLVGEVIAPLEIARRFCGETGDGLHLVFLFESLRAPLTAPAVRRLIQRYERLFPEPLLPTWVFSNHDRRRRIARLGGSIERAKLNAAWQLTGRGVPFIYYGEEVGMEQHHLPVRNSLDALAHRFRRWPQWAFDLLCTILGESLNRDECRTPMQWTAGPNAGFCPPRARPWLPPTPSYGERNVEVQRSDPDSLWHCYRRFLHARRAIPALRRGRLELRPPASLPAEVVGYTRRDDASGSQALVLLNCSPHSRGIDVPPGWPVAVSTRAHPSRPRRGELDLAPWEGVVLAPEGAS